MQKSHPWGYLLGNDSLIGYTAKEDSALYSALARAGGVVVDGGIRTLAAFANLGVFYSVDNKLAVTNPGAAANRIDVNTGMALVCGIEAHNDASMGAAADITSPAANPRIDRVVVRANFGAADYVPASASAALFTVPTNTARVTVIHGAENVAPVAPTLTQDINRATYWDIPLYQYQISVAGAITALTDERVWADAETKTLFVTPMEVFDDTAIAECNMVQYGYVLPDNAVTRMYGTVSIPADFIAGTNLTIQVHFPIKPTAVGDINISGDLKWASCGEWYDVHSDSVNGPVTVTSHATHYLINCLLTKTIVPGPFDQLFLYYTRDATAGADTINDSVYVRGWLLSYLGWR